MPATAWLRRNSVEVAWGVFAAANLVAMIAWPSWETIPFHFVWISLTLVYGFRVWSPAGDGARARRGDRRDGRARSSPTRSRASSSGASSSRCR